jgi:ABC-type sugar transport system ATPase subunit
VRPEDLRLGSEGEFSGEITLTEPLGVETILHIKTGEQTLLCLVPGMIEVQVGDPVRFNIVRERLHYFHPDGVRL